MAANKNNPGIRELLYIGGFNFSVGPVSVEPTWEEVMSVERLKDGSEQVDRPVPFAGCPDVILKMTAALEWARLDATSRQQLNKIFARPSQLDYCDWKPIIERWTGDGTTNEFKCQRRPMLEESSLSAFFPSGASTLYATVVTVNGSAVTPTWLTTDAKYRRAFTVVTIPTNGHEVLCEYVPLYRMRRSDSKRTYEIPHRETAAMVLTEAN